METKELNKNVAQIFESRYIIPLYQRNFAWREPQISRLLKDVYEAFQRNPQGNYFIGSMVVRRRRGEDFEVIDGQQRLTALSLITKVLDIKHEQRLSYDSRPYVEEFLNSFYTKGSVHEVNHPSITYLKEAVEIIKTTNLCDESEGDKVLTIYDPEIRQGFAAYFANHVILVRVEIPEDTDVADYFEIMNNRGEQLQEHEIIKSLLISKIKDESGVHYDVEKQKEFSLIWDACSQMDEPIQKLFNTRRRRMYFGHTFDNFIFEGLGGQQSGPNQIQGPQENENQDNKANKSEGYTLDEILSGNYRKDYDDNLDNVIDEDISFTDEKKYASIIDFPNFLMHIFKAFYNKEYQEKTGNDVPLDAKFMHSVYEKLKDVIDPKEFIFNLFRSRTFFDRYVVKTIENEGGNNTETEGEAEEDGVSWLLQRVRLKGNKMYFINTFNECPPLQNRAVKALSMLQVTFRNRKYKTWLQVAIQWFKTQNTIAVDPIAFIKLLDGYMLERYHKEDYNSFERIDKEELTKENSISTGVGTAHFLFTFIDYLYWVESGNSTHNIAYSDRITNFDFKYWNSVEHHLSRKKAHGIKGSENFIDNLGNLCLVSKKANSRLSDRDVKEKVQAYSRKNMGANRQIIYSITEGNGYEWNGNEIKKHYNDLIDLLSKMEEILQL